MTIRGTGAGRAPCGAPRRGRRTISSSLAVALLGALAVLSCRHDEHDESRVGTLVPIADISGYSSAEATTISADGLVVAGTATSSTGRRQAFRWTAQHGTVALGFLPGGSNSSAAGTSADGAVTVGTSDGMSPGVHAVRWNADAGPAALEPLRSSTLCVAAAVSGDGTIVVGTCLAPNNEGVRWTGAAPPAGLGRLGTGSNAASTANAISPDGRFVGGSGHPVLTGATIWNADGVPTIIGGLPNETQGYIAGLAENATVAVGSSVDASGRAHAFRWTPGGGVVALPARPEFVATTAAGVSRDGRRTVGWATTASGVDVAVIWDSDDRIRPVAELLAEGEGDRASVSLARARAVSANGRAVAGQGFDAEGRLHAWVVLLGD